MRGLAIGILTVAAMALMAACGGSTIPSSSLTIRDAATDALISASTAQGTITLNAGETQQIKVVHTYTSEDRNTQSNDVTQFVIFKWDSGACATIDALGNLTGTSPGVGVLRAKYDPEWLGSSDNVRLTVIVN